MNRLLLVLLFFIGFDGFSQFFEDFDGGELTNPPNWNLDSGNWTITNNNNFSFFWNYNSVPNNVYSGTNAAFMNRYNIGAGNFSYDYLISPGIFIPNNAILSFWSRTSLNGDQETEYKIKILPISYQLGSIQGFPDFVSYTENTISQQYNQYEEKTLDLSSYVGQYVHIAFVRYYHQQTPALGGDRWFVDNISINCFQEIPTVVNQTFCNTATIADLEATGNNIKWYQYMDSSEELPSTFELTDETIYYASQTILGCESSRAPCLVTINYVEPPSGSTMQSFIFGQTLNDLDVSGANIIWYDGFFDAFNNVNPISPLTPLVDGESYCANQSFINCQSAIPLCVTVSTNLATFSEEKYSFLVYPNPTNKEIFLKVNKFYGIDKIVIKDITGKVVISQIRPSNNINIETLEKGVYFIEAFSNEKKYQTKFLKI